MRALNYFRDLKNLKVLLLRGNGFEWLPENMQTISGLKVLELSRNNFTGDEKARIKAQAVDKCDILVF